MTTLRKKSDSDTYYLVLARDSDDNGRPRCINCGDVGWDVHEIIPKSSLGKSRSEELFAIKNRCVLCRGCHCILHNDNGRGRLLSILASRHGYNYTDEWEWLLKNYRVEKY